MKLLLRPKSKKITKIDSESEGLGSEREYHSDISEDEARGSVTKVVISSPKVERRLSWENEIPLQGKNVKAHDNTSSIRMDKLLGILIDI